MEREDLKLGICRIGDLYLGETNGQMGQLSMQGWHSIDLTSEIGGSGTCAVQIVFKDNRDVAMAVPVTGDFYLSKVETGLTMDAADTGIAVLTNGALFELDAAHKGWKFVSSDAGLLGFTITANQDSYWACFKKPTGILEIVGPLICDA